MNFRRNEIAFERAARDYYETVTGRTDWSTIPRQRRDIFRTRLEETAKALDREATEWAARAVYGNLHELTRPLT